MKNKKNSTNKKKKDSQSKLRKERLNRLVGVDMCACFPIYMGRCQGICRSTHTHGKTVECFCLYRVEQTEEYIAMNKKGKKSNDRGTEDSSDKDRRRERFKLKNENREDV